MWVPAFVTFLAFTADAAFTVVTYSQMWNAARETSRQMALGALTDEAEATTYAKRYLPTHADFDITADYNHGFNLVLLRISCQTGDAGVFGIFTDLTNQSLTTTMIVRQEWLPVAGSRASQKTASKPNKSKPNKSKPGKAKR